MSAAIFFAGFACGALVMTVAGIVIAYCTLRAAKPPRIFKADL